MSGSRGQRRLRRVATGLLSAAALAAAGTAVAAPGAQAKTGWKVNATVNNNVASSAATCANASLRGCVNAPLWTGVGDVDDVNAPLDIAAGASGGFSFTSPSLVEGGDMYVDYTMPTGSKYEVIVEDDDHVSGYTGAGNYVGCTQSSPQGDSAAVCSAQWGGTYEAMTPTITFGPSSQAPLPSVGQRCSGTLGGATTLIDCMDTKQFGPADPSQKMWISFRTITSGAVYVQQQNGGPNCRMGQGYASTCSLLMQPGKSLQIGSLNNAGDATYTVEVMSTASGYDVPNGLVPDPNPQSTVSAVRALQVSPNAVRPAASGSVVATSKLAKDRGATVRYRAPSDATTVFSLSRASNGERRGDSCVRTSKPVAAGRRCTVWVTLPHRDVQTGIVGSGIKRSGACRAAFTAVTSPACRYSNQLRGHFLHHGRKGTNTLRITGRLGSKRLPAGRYRLTAQSRYPRGTQVSAPVTARFTVK